MNIGNVFVADPVPETDMDDVFSVILDDFEFGVGLNASRYSEFLQDKKGVENDCYIQCHSRNGGSDEEGIVAFDKQDISPKQRFIVGFNEDEENPFDYTATISGEVYADETFDRDTLIELFSGLNITSIPFTSSKNILILLRVEPTDEGVRLWHTINIGKCNGGIGKPEMEQIYKRTLATASCISEKTV